ncbi:hypothetical protein KEM48_005440 [Puccinia striiformis f. sp. tritici PST-130]|nr:hypothetical protein KEM48_005440 [Puccinia striiformis f. sp. tritici PST-130]
MSRLFTKPSGVECIEEKVTQPTKSKKVGKVEAAEEESEEEEPSRGPASESDVVELNGFGEDESDDDSSDEDEDGNDSSEEESNQSSEDDSQAKPSSKDQPTPNCNPSKTEEESGVVYLGRIPSGFYEDEMKSYFDQFGEVLRLRLSRCKKTGKPKHYGFIEFKHVQVAQIVAETIHNYFSVEITSMQPKPSTKQTEISNRLIEREEKKRKRLVELGIDYDFPGYVSLSNLKLWPIQLRMKS